MRQITLLGQKIFTEVSEQLFKKLIEGPPIHKTAVRMLKDEKEGKGQSYRPRQWEERKGSQQRKAWTWAQLQDSKGRQRLGKERKG